MRKIDNTYKNLIMQIVLIITCNFFKKTIIL